MAINTQGLMLKLSPYSPISIGGGNLGMEISRLQLAREQFEEQKRYHDEQLKNQRLAQEGALARKQLEVQQQKQKAEARVAAELEKNKVAALNKASEYAAAGNTQGVESMVPVLGSLGVGADYLGSVGGMPSYRLDLHPEQTWEKEKKPLDVVPGQESALEGYPKDERGSLGDAPGIASTEEAFNRAKAATAASEAAPRLEDGSLAPTRAPDEEDLMGAVPANVLDMGAMHAQTLRALDPTLAALGNAYPVPLDEQGRPDNQYRESAAQTMEAVRASGLPTEKALEQFRQLRIGPDTIASAEIAARAQQGRFRESRDQLTPMQVEELKNKGQQQADKSWSRSNISAAQATMGLADQIKSVLTDDDTLNDDQVVSLIMDMSHVRGAQSDRDAARALGLDTASGLDQIVAYLHTLIAGGRWEKQKESLINFAESSRERDKKEIFQWLDTVDKEVGKSNMNEHVRSGWLTVRDRIHQDLLDEYEDYKKARSKGRPAPPAAGDSLGVEPLPAAGAPPAPAPAPTPSNAPATPEEEELDRYMLRVE